MNGARSPAIIQQPSRRVFVRDASTKGGPKKSPNTLFRHFLTAGPHLRNGIVASIAAKHSPMTADDTTLLSTLLSRPPTCDFIDRL